MHKYLLILYSIIIDLDIFLRVALQFFRSQYNGGRKIGATKTAEMMVVVMMVVVTMTVVTMPERQWLK